MEELGTTHGMSYTVTYRRWRQMIDRVRLNIQYREKGITVCERWQGFDGFIHFLEDMKECPPGKTLDRFPNPAGNYEPCNCRWATNSEQQQNKVNTKMYTYKNETGSAAFWAMKYKLSLSTVTGRLERGWTIERTLETPRGRRRGIGAEKTQDRLITYKGVEKTLGQWAVEFGLNISTMIDRIWRKWPMEKIERIPQRHRNDYADAKERNEFLGDSTSVVGDGGIVVKYLTRAEALDLISEAITLDTPQILEAMINSVYGGHRPKKRIEKCLANKFSVRFGTQEGSS